MRRWVLLLVGIAILAAGLTLGCRRPQAVPMPCPAPAPEPKPEPWPDPQEEGARRAAEEARMKSEAERAVVKPTLTLPPTITTPPAVKAARPRLVKKPTTTTPVPVPGHDQIRYSAPTTMALGVPTTCTVDIGDPQTVAKLVEDAAPYQVQNLQRASYYLIGLEGEFSDEFKIEPNPGQDQRQHRAKSGATAHWQYRVTPLKSGKRKLLYTLRVYQEGDDAGTVIRVEPVEVLVSMEWPTSHKAEALRIAREYGVWTALVGLVAALLGAWLKPRSKDN